MELDCWDWTAGENFVTRMGGAVDAANRVVALGGCCCPRSPPRRCVCSPAPRWPQPLSGRP
ncbi:MAG: toll/interleukin-1 receptor domain-containing protein [Actinomycetota bacterium]|nr:toll/interleukin-1 receptor domain-containing protein [Actinomycetota bacterium]